MTTLPRICSVEGCEKPHLARGLCSPHYERSRKANKECSVGGCEKPYAGSGYCSMHYSRVRQHGSIDLPTQNRFSCGVCGSPVTHSRPNPVCSDDCLKIKKKAYDKTRYSEIREDAIARAQAWNLENKAHKKAYDQKYRVIHQDKIIPAKREWKRQYLQAHPEYGRLAANKRRARKLANGVFVVNEKDIKKLLIRHHNLCVYCGKNPAQHLDHVIPISRGGTHGIGNLQPACQPCNNSKSNKFVSEWKLYLKKKNTW